MAQDTTYNTANVSGTGGDNWRVGSGGTLTVHSGGTLTLEAGATFSNSGSATGAAPVAGGATLTLTVASHGGKTILLDTAAGTVVTLPAATGTGAKFRFVVSVLATSNSHKVQVANSTDVIQGIIFGTRVDSGNATLGFAAASTSDTITLNRSTTGSVSVGEELEIEDYASGFFRVRGSLSATGAAFATPFSAAV